MLKAFIDDSGMNQPPLSVLAGWVAPAERWEGFCHEWQRILRMKPRVEYFKYTDAIRLKGQFHGISLHARNEKCSLLVGATEEYELLGVATIILHDVFHWYFGKNDKGVMRHPYLISFYEIISLLYRYLVDSV